MKVPVTYDLSVEALSAVIRREVVEVARAAQHGIAQQPHPAGIQPCTAPFSGNIFTSRDVIAWVAGETGLAVTPTMANTVLRNAGCVELGRVGNLTYWGVGGGGGVRGAHGGVRGYAREYRSPLREGSMGELVGIVGEVACDTINALEVRGLIAQKGIDVGFKEMGSVMSICGWTQAGQVRVGDMTPMLWRRA